MQKYLFLLIAVIAGTLQAKQLHNPDKNTFWLEDGKDMQLSPVPGYNKWYRNKKVPSPEFLSGKDGKGFSLLARDQKGRRTVTLLKTSPEFPFLEFRITDVEYFKGYKSWAIFLQNYFSSSQVSTLQKGIYVYDLFKNLPEKDPKRKTSSYLYIYLYCMKVNLEYMKMVKKPAYTVEVDCKEKEIRVGSKVKFTASLSEEAEDVSLSLLEESIFRPIKINGKIKIQLKPADKTGKVWIGEVDVKNLGIKKPRPRHRTLIKMDVLGGELDEPVWVGLPYKLVP